jgi:hypothetical protein
MTIISFTFQGPTKNIHKFGYLVCKYVYHLATLMHWTHVGGWLIYDNTHSLTAKRETKWGTVLWFIELSLGSAQGCQIFMGTFYQNGENLYQKTIKYTEWPQTIPKEKIYQHTKIFHCYTLQNLPKLFFGFVNLPSGNPSSAYLGGHTSCLNQRDVGPSKLFSPLFLKHSANSRLALKAAKPRFEVFF